MAYKTTIFPHGTFSNENKYVAFQGTTNNLMDYSCNATSTDLYKYQWDYIHNPESVLFRGDDEEGEFNFIIEPILKSIREANLKKESNLKLSVRAGSYKTADVSLNSYLLKYIGLDASGTAVEFLERKNREFTINPAEQSIETYTDESNVNCKKYTFHVVGKADVAFVMDVLESESKRFEDWLFSPYEISTEQLSSIYPTATPERVKAVTEAINKYCNDFEINTPERMAHFLGQIGVEATANLDGLSENCSYSATNIKNIFAKRTNSTRTIDNRKFKQLTNADLYDGMSKSNDYYFPIHNNIACYDTIYHFFSPKYDIATAEIYADLGINTYYTGGKNNCALFNYVYCCNKSNLGNGDYESGDGARFRGRGFIHLTGRSNYTTYLFNPWKKKYPDDKRTIEQIMDLLETDIDLAIKVSMVYWEANNINSYITNTTNFSNTNDEIRKVSGCVNVGNYKTNIEKINGYTERLNNTIKAYESLNKK